MLNITLFSMITLFNAHQPQINPSAPCDTWLQRIETVAVSQDYQLKPTKSGFAGRSKQGTQLEANCELGHAGLQLVDAEGSSATLDFTGAPTETLFALEMTGVFPNFGQVVRTHVFEVRDSGLEGFTSFSAATGHDFASVDFAADGSTVNSVGDASRANSAFEPRLAKSAAWRDANTFLYGLAGMLGGLQEAAGEDSKGAMDGLFSIAIPTPHSEGADQDDTHVLRVCSASGTACAVSIFIPVAFPGCAVGTAGCLAALGCWVADCAGDDEPATS